MDLGFPAKLRIEPNEDRTEFRFLLLSPEGQTQASFDTSAEGAMTLMVALQRLQVRHKIPIPQALRPAGVPALRVLTDEDE